MAQAVPEKVELFKGIRWYDGFVVALANPGFLIGSLGYSIGALGGWGAALLWSISMLIGVGSNWIYAEMASMFPDKPGGIALYAHEGWRRYFSLIGVVATFGYWFAWSTVLSIFGIVVGTLVQSQWFPGQTWTFFDGAIDVGLPHFIAAGLILLVWAFNIFGIRPAVWFGYVTGVLLLIPLAVFIIGPFVTGQWQAANLHFGMGDNHITLKLALVWLYVMGWSSYGVEACAAFAPEYKDTVNDTNRALKSAALFSLVVYALLPLGITGTIGEQAAVKDPVAFYVPAFTQIVGGASGLMVFLLAASLVLSMNTATADGSRALYGIARDDMTIKELYQLNKYRVPSRAMTVDMIVNLLLVFFVGNTLGILVAGNLGYILAHFFALTGFLLLRKDRPDWPRPIRANNIWIPIAALLAVANLVFIIFGVTNPDITGYGTFRDLLIGVGVLLISVLLYIYRRVAQDHQSVRLREMPPPLPPAGAHG
ncbi:APC family permease [Dongia soli]|uniref:APC family permease n=1 Tax=Dongia soli TaxID=600628 RepID=A0ABU5EDT8_9PROT|nr:APC family permease [Dongia soli]MDY0884533.1 APC family permease [Dongia soli]